MIGASCVNVRKHCLCQVFPLRSSSVLPPPSPPRGSSSVVGGAPPFWHVARAGAQQPAKHGHTHGFLVTSRPSQLHWRVARKSSHRWGRSSSSSLSWSTFVFVLVLVLLVVVVDSVVVMAVAVVVVVAVVAVVGRRRSSSPVVRRRHRRRRLFRPRHRRRRRRCCRCHCCRRRRPQSSVVVCCCRRRLRRHRYRRRRGLSAVDPPSTKMWDEATKDAQCRRMTAKRASLTDVFQVPSFLKFPRTTPHKRKAKSMGETVRNPRRDA